MVECGNFFVLLHQKIIYPMRRIVLFTTLLLSALLMWADDSYRFQTLTTADGLSSSTVKCMLIDNRGFLWIGTVRD